MSSSVGIIKFPIDKSKMFQTTNQLRMAYYWVTLINYFLYSIFSVESLGNGNLNENISFEIQDCNYYSRNGRFHGKIGF